MSYTFFKSQKPSWSLRGEERNCDAYKYALEQKRTSKPYAEWDKETTTYRFYPRKKKSLGNAILWNLHYNSSWHTVLKIIYNTLHTSNANKSGGSKSSGPSRGSPRHVSWGDFTRAAFPSHLFFKRRTKSRSRLADTRSHEDEQGPLLAGRALERHGLVLLLLVVVHLRAGGLLLVHDLVLVRGVSQHLL